MSVLAQVGITLCIESFTSYDTWNLQATIITLSAVVSMYLFMFFFAIKPSEFFLKGFCHFLLYKQEQGRCMLSKPAQWQHMQRYYSFIVEMLLTPVISYFPLVMDIWKGLRSSRLISSCPKLCHPKFLVNLPLMLSYLA